MQVLDKGWVELDDYMASDQKVIKRARVSNVQPSQRRREEERSPAQDQSLINYLMRNRHGSPFEGSVFEFYVKCPLFVRSEWHRHRMASYNEMSGRYVRYEPEFYIPEHWRVQALTNKQGSLFPDPEWLEAQKGPYFGKYPEFSNTETYHTWWWDSVENFDLCLTNVLTRHTEESFSRYESLLDMGAAKEMARMVLPPNLYTAFYMTVNARSLMNFLSLRNADNSQWEIRQYAIAMEGLFKEMMPMTYQAWVDNGRIAP